MVRRRVDNTYLTPFDLAAPTQVGKRTFRKQILPLTTINYKGRKIQFDKPFLTDLAKSFNDRAYDQVPFVFADPDNKHNESPRNFGGEITSVELADDGLYATITTTREGARVIKNNPKLGVSARIIEGVEKADGRSYKRALRHVLGTLDPRVTGMGPWQAVDLSEDDENKVVDLTTETYKEGRMAKKNKGGTVVKVGDRSLDLSSLSDEDFQTLLDLAVAAPPKRGTRKTKVRRDADGNVTEEVTEDIEDILNEDDPEDADDIEDVTDEMDDEDDEDADESDEDEDDAEDDLDEEDPDEDDLDEDDESDEDEDEEEGEPVATVRDRKKKVKVKAKVKGNPFRGSEEDQEGTDLSNVQTFIDEQVKRQWKSDRREYAQAGVPAHLLDLAEPVLSSRAASTIDLANGETVDAGEAMRNMLDGVKGMVDLTPEVGHQVDLTEETDEDKAFLEAWDKQFGTV